MFRKSKSKQCLKLDITHRYEVDKCQSVQNVIDTIERKLVLAKS